MASVATAATSSTVSAPFKLETKLPVKPAPRVTLSSVTANNVGTLRKLNEAAFPVTYSDKYYADVLDETMEDFNKLVYYADVPVGAVTCRFEPALSAPATTPAAALKLHVLTLNVLPAYRSQGLGAHLLEHVVSKATAWSPPAAAAEGGPASKTRAASKEQGQAAERKVEAVLVYCQVDNEQAKAFYTQKAGFVEKETVENYYHKIEPRAAVLLERQLTAA